MSSISKVAFTNAKGSSEIFGEYSPESVDFEQVWRIHLLDMLDPYCEHRKNYVNKSRQGRVATRLWQDLMAECSAWEVKQGY